MNPNDLIAKYNVAAPRYTSYPTVPYWSRTPSQEEWKQHVSQRFSATNSINGISLYIHLPFCESLCTYCACNTRITVNHKVEEPYIDSLLREWGMYLAIFNEKPRLREIHLGGGTPTFFSPANLHKLINGILSTAEVCHDAEFSFEGHPNNTTAGHLQTLFDLGFRRVSFGIQDFDPLVQDVINRIQPYENVERVVRQAREIGYSSINFDLVYGLPFQHLHTISETISKVITLRPDRIAFYSYAHVPWLKPGQRKYGEKDLPKDLEKRQLYEKGLELFTTAGYRDVGMDHFALPGDSLLKALEQKTLHRNFMGYTAGYTQLMVSLGSSAIGDSWDAFAQNHKTVEGYRAAIERNEFPIVKGHVLSKEEQVIRTHILNIMCQGETHWDQPEMQCDALYEGLKRCEGLAADGLIELTPFGLKVTKTGFAFLRNICLCFDSLYWAQQPQEKVFSSTV